MSFLSSEELGFEVNVTGKYFMSKNIMLRGDVAATFPGEAIDQALGPTAARWISTMLFFRVGY